MRFTSIVGYIFVLVLARETAAQMLTPDQSNTPQTEVLRGERRENLPRQKVREAKDCGGVREILMNRRRRAGAGIAAVRAKRNQCATAPRTMKKLAA